MLFGTKLSSQKGMTLIELLAAITILGIVFVGLLSIFPQMTKFNMQTEDKLETMNLAKKELAELKEESISLFESAPDSDYVELGTKGSIVTLVKNNDDYQYEVDYDSEEDLAKYEDDPRTVQLNKIHIKVKKDGKVISETFGYLKQ